MPIFPSTGGESSRGAAASSLLVAVALAAVTLELLRRSRNKRKKAGWITDLHRFAVKGLERDTLSACTLEVGACFPSDRMWALIHEDKLAELFDAQNPKWVNKMNFYAACSAGVPLACFSSTYDDQTTTLTIREKRTEKVRLQARMGEEEGRRDIEHFFMGIFNSGVRVVFAAEGRNHQFGNTSSGIDASGDVRTIHLVNRATVQCLSDVAGEDIDVLRFRANIIFDGLQPWEEFRWVGGFIAVGNDVVMRVIKRTVRCAATSVDIDEAAPGSDVPGLLQRHFPEHGPYLGVYAQVVKGGTIHPGDDVRLTTWW